jgi:hypothetical protein
MSVNDGIRQSQKKGGGQTASSGLVSEIAKTTGVDEADVAKVLDELGFSRSRAAALRLNDGQEPAASSVRLALRLGRTTIIM